MKALPEQGGVFLFFWSFAWHLWVLKTKGHWFLLRCGKKYEQRGVMMALVEGASKEVIKQEIQINPHKKLAITVSWCKSCGICMELCPQGVLGAEPVTKRIILIAPEACNGCGLCELACPDYVFTIEELNTILA